MSDTLPAGWTGNLAHHHADRGPFTLTVSKVSLPARRFGWSLAVGRAIVGHSDHLGHPDAATARAAVLARLAEIVGEVDEVPVPLAVVELPDVADMDAVARVVVLAEGRPLPAIAYGCNGKIQAHVGPVYYPADTPVYPESAAPALWRAYLRGRS